MKIWIVCFDHEYGTDVHAFHKYLDAYDTVRDYLESWFEAGDYAGPGAEPSDYVEYVKGDTVTIALADVQ